MGKGKDLIRIGSMCEASNMGFLIPRPTILLLSIEKREDKLGAEPG